MKFRTNPRLARKENLRSLPFGPSPNLRLGPIFALENHITYQRELKLSDPLRVTLQLLDHNEKRIHYFMRMFHHERDYLAATCEHLSIYVDFHKRHATPLSTEARAKLEEIYQTHRKLPKPEEAGRVMGIRRR